MTTSHAKYQPAPSRLEQQFPDKKPLMTATQALAEATRCLYCFDAPCIKACPTSIQIPEFIRKISTSNTRGAARTIFDANILGLSCSRVCPVEVLCEGDCVYNLMDQKPIEIGRLQRFATEYAYDRGLQYFTAGPSTGKRVALVGAGPASLACAHELTKLGHTAVVLEARTYPGGLNTDGVAPYKLQVTDSLREAEYIQRIGFDIRYGVRVGEDVTFDQLERDYDAIFVGVGLGRDSWMDIPGNRLPGVWGALDLIERIKLGGDTPLQGLQHAVVVGAGNTAMDVIRELLGLGVPHVTMIYRRDEEAMSGYAHEWTGAKDAGARASWWSQPVAFEGTDHLTGVRCQVRGQDAPVIIPAQVAALAIGQHKFAELLQKVPGLKLDKGAIAVDAQTGQTGNPRYFSGGDCANGGKEVVNAAAEGKRAAQGIHALFSTQSA